MKKMMIGLMAMTSVSAFANTNCVEMVKKATSLLASGSMPVAGRYGVDVKLLKENAILKSVDAAGNEDSINADILRATAFFDSHGRSYKAWVSPGFESNKGCTILKISLEGIQ